MKFFMLVFCLLFYKIGKCQTNLKNPDTLSKPELFSSGFIDIINNGQVNASARILKLYIGEPGRFSLPISFYGGVSNNSFGGGSGSKSNEHLINQYINPLSGLVNISIDNNIFLKKTQKRTKASIIYQVGERLLSGQRIGPASDPLTGKTVNFLNAFATSGILFQTGAWEKTNTQNIGIFWATARYHFCHSSPTQLKEFLSELESNGSYSGYSLGFGILINKIVDIKAIFYKYMKAPEMDYVLPIYQFSFNYYMSK